MRRDRNFLFRLLRLYSISSELVETFIFNSPVKRIRLTKLEELIYTWLSIYIRKFLRSCALVLNPILKVYLLIDKLLPTNSIYYLGTLVYYTLQCVLIIVVRNRSVVWAESQKEIATLNSCLARL